MRIHVVQKARKAQASCGKCSAKIGVGDPYIWIKPRHGGKRIRCTGSKCRFRTSEMVGGKMSGVYAVTEGLEDFLAGEWEPGDDAKEACRDAAEQVREVAQEYTDSADNIEQVFSSSDTADQCREKADELESFADELESCCDSLDDVPSQEDISDDDLEGIDEDSTDEEKEEAREAKLAEMMDALRDEYREAIESALGSCP